MGIPEKITLTGKVFIKYIDDLAGAKIGDIKLYLNDDAINPFPGDYENLVQDGYIKGRVFDGRKWHNMDIGEFCLHRENRFPKKQKSIDSAYLCKSIMEEASGAILIKKYRGHFVRFEG
jgi:hypothetical protein